ncbi:hypothetical protein C1O63_1433 [Dehalococcoides mccartyi]|nr:hypothetical protein C1O63_1433 [Dehalococcoides mccartyi]
MQTLRIVLFFYYTLKLFFLNPGFKYIELPIADNGRILLVFGLKTH